MNGRNHNATSPWPFVAMCGMAVAFFPYAGSGMFAPWYAVVGLMLVWFALFVLVCSWWMRRPTWTPAVPVIAFVILYGTVALGGAFLGWGA